MKLLVRATQQPELHWEFWVHNAAHVPPFAVTHVVPSQHTADPAHEPPAAEQVPTPATGDATKPAPCLKQPVVRLKFVAAEAVFSCIEMTPVEKPSSRLFPFS
jgi:hypothetical protein